MKADRLEAFSDGVLAIIITIMVLELKIPHGTSLEALRPLLPAFLSYVLSFVYLGIYWNNHHHVMLTACTVTGSVLWANLHLLFWLSLLPFATGWMGENGFSRAPTALYGVVLLGAGIAYWLLQRAIIAAQGKGSLLGKALGRDLKGISTLILEAAAVAACFWSPRIAQAIYALLALMWVVPDRRIERVISEGSPTSERGIQ